MGLIIKERMKKFKTIELIFVATKIIIFAHGVKLYFD